MLKKLLFTTLMLFGIFRVFSQDFGISDVLVSSYTSNIFDPEYNTTLNKVCWISAENELWICNLDPINHNLIPSDGKGLKIADSLRPFSPGGWNGPEWMLSAFNTQVVYTKMVNNVSYPAIATMGAMQWPSQVLPYPGCVYAMATHNYNDADAMMLFETSANEGIKWLSTSNISQVLTYSGATLGFFANTGSQICAVRKHNDQPGFIETNAIIPYFSSISDDTAAAPFMWDDPETEKRLFMYRTHRGKQLKIFIETEPNKWWPYQRFYSPAEPPYDYINSPEPFVFAGKSYISFAASTSATGNQMPPSQIWIASANPDDAMFRRISDPLVPVCVDPEPVVFEDEAFVYYSEKFQIDNTNYRLRVRKCRTGLTNPTTGESLVKPAPALKIFPNPAHDTFTVASDLLKHPCKLEINNLSGACLLVDPDYKNGKLIDTVNLPCGFYLVRLISQEGTAAANLIIAR